MTDTHVDPDRCPLCGGSNRCGAQAARAQGRDLAAVQDCWCMRTPVAPEALARVPVDARGLACLCPRCAALTSPTIPSTLT